MLQGCNVLASNVCENPKLLKNGKYGLLFDPHSPIEICKSIEKFYDIGHKERSKLAKNAMIFAKQTLNIDKMINSFLELIYKN
jgi:glycosyltransferase involved in cell wall biosynthesis